MKLEPILPASIDTDFIETTAWIENEIDRVCSIPYTLMSSGGSMSKVEVLQLNKTFHAKCLEILRDMGSI